MAQREMSGPALLDKLYSGLDRMPAVEAEIDAGDLRRLSDEFLGKPTEPTASGRRPATASRAASNARPASRVRMLRLPDDCRGSRPSGRVRAVRDALGMSALRLGERAAPEHQAGTSC